MKLVITSGPLAGRDLPVDKSVLVIGRASNDDIVLEDNQVSRRHAEVRFSGGQVSITDLGSMNGTYVNGARITGTQALRPGDHVRIGQTQFTLQGGLATPTPAPMMAEADLGAPAPVAARRGANPLLIAGGVAVLLVLALLAGGAFLLLGNRGNPAATGGGTATPINIAAITPSAQARATDTPGTAATQAPAGATNTPMGQPVATLTPIVVAIATLPPGAAAATPAPTGAARPAATTAPQTPPYTVQWSPGRYEGWADGKRMSSDLTIHNISLPEITPPYKPYFIVSDLQGNMRSADLQDYGGGKGPPAIAKGKTILWTWFGIMKETEWVRGSVFRYAGIAWAQEFNPDGSLSGPPRVIDEKNAMPFVPRQVSPEMMATIQASYK